MRRIAVLGAGSWGTTLANLLAAKGEQVCLWAFEPEVVAAINQTHENTAFLPGVALAPELRAVTDPGEAVAGAE
ncbi:MAG: glycerol-3-phosphate dehydrogenase, partial [Gemmatimonadales bacterium]|nr:glycerol-3-phosphate dehydrogenase [Gemmatimonadales bacterium]